jgi:preprotein translocase SecE subunit
MTIDNERLLQYALYGLGLVVWFVLWKFIAGISAVLFLVLNRAEPEIPLFQNMTFLAAFLAFALTAAAVEYSRRHPVASRFGMDVLSEMRKVSWPSWKVIRGTTLVVLGVTIFTSFVLFLFDAIYSGLIKLLYPA